MGYDETISLTSLSWCNSRGKNSTHHGHYTMASVLIKVTRFASVSLCSVFNLNNKNVNALIARQLSGFTCTRSLTMNSKFSIPHEAFEISRSLLVNSCRYIAIIHSLSALTCNYNKGEMLF